MGKMKLYQELITLLALLSEMVTTSMVKVCI
jgi:hypothetical protein